MVLTYYEHINESRGISNFVKKLSTVISGSIFKEYEKISDDLIPSFDIKLNINFEEISKLKHINIIIKGINCDYHSKFYISGDDLLNDIVLEFDLPVKSKLDYFYLHELVVHEMTHIYEYYNIVNNQREFPLYNRIKKSLIRTIIQDEFDIFSYFRNLVYLTLDNELNARVAQTYQLLSYENINNKEQLFNILKTKHIWKKYKEIDNFNPRKYTSDLIELIGLDFSKILINKFNEELKNNHITFSFIKNVNDEKDIIEYFNKWNRRFKYKLKKHLYKLNKVIDEVIKDKTKNKNKIMIITEYLKNYDLTEEWSWIEKNNKGNSNPYHNNEHLKRVFEFSLFGCDYYNIDFYYTRLVGAAALFHDFNHSGGKLPDSENIKMAIEGFLEFNSIKRRWEKNKSDIIVSLIEETIYPHVKSSEDLTLIQNILRDSDVIQGLFHEDYLNKVVFAIAEEANISKEKMLENQKGFLENIKFGTEWAEELFKKSGKK